MVIKVMIVFLACILIMIIGIFLDSFLDWDFAGPVIAMVGGIFLITAIALWPLEYYGDKAMLIKYQELQRTVDYARLNNPSELERATLIDKIASANMNIKSMQYWNNTTFDIFIPDEIMTFEMLK